MQKPKLFFRICTNGCLGEKKKGMDERKKPKHKKLYPSIFNMFKKRVWIEVHEETEVNFKKSNMLFQKWEQNV